MNNTPKRIWIKIPIEHPNLEPYYQVDALEYLVLETDEKLVEYVLKETKTK